MHGYLLCYALLLGKPSTVIKLAKNILVSGTKFSKQQPKKKEEKKKKMKVNRVACIDS